MTQNYPDTEGYGFNFVTAEFTIAGRIFTAVVNVSLDQPTEEGEIRGTKIGPLKRTPGTMAKGSGSITFSDYDEWHDFINLLGDGWRDKLWGLSYLQRHARTGKSRKIQCISCRSLSEPIDHEEGSDGLGGEINFSYMDHKVDGKRPHAQ